MKHNTINIEWKKYVNDRNKKLFQGEEHQSVTQESKEEITNYIMRCINEDLDRNLKIPLTCNYSSNGMSEFQKLTFLIEQSGKKLSHDFFATIIYDEYRIEDGTQGIYDIISNYVNWIDTK